MLLLERDELQFVVCKNIETKYMLTIGALEYKVYEAECMMLRLKRKSELVRAKKNRQEQVFLSEIEKILDKEFEEYQQRLNEQIKRMNDAIEHSKGEVLTAEEQQELKKSYRQIVKALHPDLHPDGSDGKIRLFENAVTAYKNGDLMTLRVIFEMIKSPVYPDKEEDALTLLKKEAECLGGVIQTIRGAIDKIKTEYPYSVKEIVEDPEKMKERQEELNTLLTQYLERIAHYEAMIEEMLR